MFYASVPKYGYYRTCEKYRYYGTVAEKVNYPMCFDFFQNTGIMEMLEIMGIIH